jgi:hypothetical protein
MRWSERARAQNEGKNDKAPKDMDNKGLMDEINRVDAEMGRMPAGPKGADAPKYNALADRLSTLMGEADDRGWVDRDGNFTGKAPRTETSAAKTLRVKDSEFESLNSATDVSEGERVWHRSNGDGKTWGIESGTVIAVNSRDGMVGIRNDDGSEEGREYWQVMKPPAGKANDVYEVEAF